MASRVFKGQNGFPLLELKHSLFCLCKKIQKLGDTCEDYNELIIHLFGFSFVKFLIPRQVNQALSDESLELGGEFTTPHYAASLIRKQTARATLLPVPYTSFFFRVWRKLTEG